MLAYAENSLRSTSDKGQSYARVFVNDFDSALETLVQARGYSLDERRDRPISDFATP